MKTTTFFLRELFKTRVEMKKCCYYYYFLQESFQRQCFEDKGSDLFCEKSARIANQTSSSPAATSEWMSAGRL